MTTGYASGHAMYVLSAFSRPFRPTQAAQLCRRVRLEDPPFKTQIGSRASPAG